MLNELFPERSTQVIHQTISTLLKAGWPGYYEADTIMLAQVKL